MVKTANIENRFYIDLLTAFVSFIVLLKCVIISSTSVTPINLRLKGAFPGNMKTGFTDLKKNIWLFLFFSAYDNLLD